MKSLLIVLFATFCFVSCDTRAAETPTDSTAVLTPQLNPDAAGYNIVITPQTFGPYEAQFIKWMTYLVAIVLGARVIVKLTPTPKDDTVLDAIVQFLKTLGLHIPVWLFAGLLLPVLSSCSLMTAFGEYAMTPGGQAAITGIKDIAVAVEHEIEAPRVAKVIANAQAAIAKLPAKTGNPATDLGRDLKEDGWRRVISLAQLRYTALTGGKYVVPNVNPL